MLFRSRGTGVDAKLKKSLRIKASETEKAVAHAFHDLEISHKNFKPTLGNFYVNAVKEITVADRKKALVIFYPLRYIRKVRKIQKSLVQELEKKFTGKQILLVAQRKMQRKPVSNMAFRQRARCLTAVHDSILEDLFHPVEIVGRRWHFGADGSKRMQIFFDAKHKDAFEGKLDVFESVAKALTGRVASFGFMTAPALQQIQRA